MTDGYMEKESIVKTLLTSTNPYNLNSKMLSTPRQSSQSSIQYVIPPSYARSRISDEPASKMHNQFRQYGGSAVDPDQGVIAMDHCYARPLNWTPESAFFQPTKTLFMPTAAKVRRRSTNPLAPSTSMPRNSLDEIDIETVDPDPPELYDVAKASNLMNECEKHVSFGKQSRENEEWEDNISKANWTPVQNMVFSSMVNILHGDQLARLAYKDVHHEPILRRLLVDKSVKRARQLFATISWDCRITQWLHLLLIDNLSASYLGAYLDILQTLKVKLPTFVDKMMYGPNSNSRVGITSNENLFHLLKRPWDPLASNLSQNRPRKLPGNPIIIVVPSGPTVNNVNQFKRQHKWNNLLANLTTVVVVNTNIGNSAGRLTMTNCADQMLTSTRAKVLEVKNDFPGRPIVLVGYNAGAALALQVAQVEHVLCVVCLGFSVMTAEGKRGEPDDSLLELQSPVLFIVGQCSNTSFREDLEDLRERMRVENSLIVVGSADDYLRVNKRTKRAEGITQSAVDRIIVENIGEFVSGILLSPYPPQIRQSPTFISADIGPSSKRVKLERKRNNSNGSSIESEPPSPTPKITRPVGRPPGSKSKAKLEARWAAHVAQGIPSPSNSPPPTLTPINTNTSLSPPSLQPINTFPLEKGNLKHPLGDSENSQADISAPNVSSIKTRTTTAAAALRLNRSVLTSGSALSSLLHNRSSSLALSKQTGIKVLENLTLNTNSTGKLISSTTGLPLDLSKITVLNSMNPSKVSGAIGNMMLMPDGKIKTIGSTVKGTGNTPLLLPMANKTKPPIVTIPGSAHRVAKYITSKKQLIGRKPPHPLQKASIVPSYSASLPPPTNLTSQDIMDLPIIFADDNQMLTDNSKLQQSDIAVPEIIQPPPKHSQSNPVGKFVFINKQMPPQPIAIANTATLKRPPFSVPVRTNNNPVKYTKIIISRASTSEHKPLALLDTISSIGSFPADISIRKVEPLVSSLVVEPIDLENAIAASTIPNPRVKSEYESLAALNRGGDKSGGVESNKT